MVVQACCDQEQCITLYAPGVQGCWIPLFEIVFPTLVRNQTLPEEVLEAAKVIQKNLEKLQITDFEKQEAENIRKMFESQK